MHTGLRRGIACGLIGLAVSACSAGGGTGQRDGGVSPAPAPAPGLTGDGLDWPPVTRQASAEVNLAGSAFSEQLGGEVLNGELVFRVEPGGKSTAASYYYAIYVFNDVSEDALALTVRFISNYQNPVWLALANWQTQCWDFSAGSFLSAAGVAFNDKPAGVTPYRSPDGALVVAVLMSQLTADVRIQALELLVPEEASGLQASMDRWDGIQLQWIDSPDADGYIIFRRPLGATPEEPWVELTDTPVSQAQQKYLDVLAYGAQDFVYLLRSAYRRQLGGTQRWFYSSGVYAIGRRQVTSLNPGPTERVDYWPLNLFNCLGFFWTTPPDIGVDGVSNTTYPATDSWQALDYLDGAPQLELLSLEDLPAPFGIIQDQEMNNTTLTIGYSTPQGLFAQVAEAAEDGSVVWEAPVQVREAGAYFLGFVPLPRRLGAVSWNPVLERMELVDSIDLHGRRWYEFEPEIFPWMLVTDHRPSGELQMEYFISGEIISYLEWQTNNLVIMEHGYNEWVDLSPGVFAGSRPRVCWLTSPGYPSTLSVVYLDDQLRRIRSLRQTLSGQWLTNEIEDLVIAKNGQQITDFKLYTFGDDVSYANYLVYVLDGSLYFRYTNNPALQTLSSPYLLDGSGDVTHLDVVRIGTDEDYLTSNLFATYYSADEDGVTRINFRDMLALRPPGFTP